MATDESDSASVAEKVAAWRGYITELGLEGYELLHEYGEGVPIVLSEMPGPARQIILLRWRASGAEPGWRSPAPGNVVGARNGEFD